MVKIILTLTRSRILTPTLAIMSITLLIALHSSGILVTSKNTHVESNPPAADDQATKARLSEAYGKLPLGFEANLGQTDPQVKFLSRGSGYSLFLTSTEAVLTLNRGQGSGDSDRGASLSGQSQPTPDPRPQARLWCE